eukprot:s384_g14.t1
MDSYGVLPNVVKGPSVDTLNPNQSPEHRDPHARRKSLDEVGITSEYEDQLDEIYDVLDGADERAKQRILEGKWGLTFIYKKRRCKGSAIHIAALNSDSALLERLLEMSADIHVECTYVAFEKEGRAQPIHLAVQGCFMNVQLLLEARADINARVKLDGESHFCPLHDAVYFRNLEMVNHLLANSANVNDKNLDGMTPLHVAAKMGANDVSDLLVRFGADIELRDLKQRTALEVAVESGIFPPRRLHVLARFRIGDILIVSEHCPSNTVDFMRALLCDYVGADRADQVAHKSYVADELQKEESLDETTPDAADYLLEILTVEPDEDCYRRSNLELRADYNTDESWKCDTEKGNRDHAWPEWHDKLAPSAKKSIFRSKSNRQLKARSNANIRNNGSALFGMRDQLNHIQMRQLRLKGIISTQALLALSLTNYVEIFRNQAIAATLQYCWTAFVGRWYMLQVTHRCLELLVLSAWTFSKSLESNNYQVPLWQRRLTWTIMLESALHDFFYEACQAYGFIVTMQSPGAYLGNVANYVDIAAIVSFNYLVFTALIQGNYQLDFWHEFFAVLVFLRWLHVLYNLRAFKLGMLGVKSIIPILHSVKKIGGMMIICFFVFCGFCHAFLVLDNGVTGGPWVVLIGSIKLLFTVDGDGIIQTLKLGGRGDAAGNGDYITAASLLIAVIVFCISLLNIFIAVHGRAYEQAHSHATNLFLQDLSERNVSGCPVERADICVHCMVQPVLPVCMTRGRLFILWLILSFLFVGSWLLCILIEETPGLLAALLLFAGVSLLKCCLVIRPWESEEVRQRSFLWWCAPSNKDYNTADEDQKDKIIQDMSERMARVEQALVEIRSALKEGGGAPLAKVQSTMTRWRNPWLSLFDADEGQKSEPRQQAARRVVQAVQLQRLSLARTKLLLVAGVPDAGKTTLLREVFKAKPDEDFADGDGLQRSHAAQRWEESRLAAMLNAKILSAPNDAPTGSAEPEGQGRQGQDAQRHGRSFCGGRGVGDDAWMMDDLETEKRFESFFSRSPDERDRLALIMSRFASAELHRPAAWSPRLVGSGGEGFGHEKLGEAMARKRMDSNGCPKGLLPIVGTWRSQKTKCFYFYFDLRDRSDIEFPSNAMAIEHWRSDQLIRLETAVLFNDVNADVPMGFGRLTDAKKAAVDEFEDGDGIVIPSITGDRHQFGSLTFDKNLQMFRKLCEMPTPHDGRTVPRPDSPVFGLRHLKAGLAEEGRTDEVLFELHPRGDLRFRPVYLVDSPGFGDGEHLHRFGSDPKLWFPGDSLSVATASAHSVPKSAVPAPFFRCQTNVRAEMNDTMMSTGRKPTGMKGKALDQHSFAVACHGHPPDAMILELRSRYVWLCATTVFILWVFGVQLAFNGTFSARELEGLLRDPRDFSRVVTVLGSRKLPNVITYSAAMNSASKTGDWAMATALLRQLETGLGGPNLISYNTVISALARARRWQGALEVFEELVSWRWKGFGGVLNVRC